MEKIFTVSVFTENRIGILNRITIIFTRRHLNIESITASESEVRGVYRYTIVLKTTSSQIKKVVNQIEKLVEVLKAFVHEEHEILHSEIALYKIKADTKYNNLIEIIVRQNNARILNAENQFVVIEKTGYPEETQKLFEQLHPLGMLEFARSGRVAVTKPMKELSAYLEELETIN